MPPRRRVGFEFHEHRHAWFPASTDLLLELLTDFVNAPHEFGIIDARPTFERVRHLVAVPGLGNLIQFALHGQTTAGQLFRDRFVLEFSVTEPLYQVNHL